jgi:MSHA biogenesis protein MshL
MHSVQQKIAALVLLSGLAGCAATQAPQGGQAHTYSTIQAELGKAVADSRRSEQSDAVAAALLPPMKIELPKARAPLEDRFSISLNNTPAQQFFNSIVTGTRYNMLIGPEVAGNITLNLKDVTLFEALDAVRDVYGYEYKVEGTRIHIQPLTMQSRMFKINYLTSTRKSASDIRVSSSSVGNAGPSSSGGNQQGQNNQQQGQQGQNNQQQVDSSRINTANTNDFWADLRTALETIVGKGDGRSVIVSGQSGVVFIKAMPDELRNVAAYLKATQLSVERQVILEAKILEVQLNDSFQNGINWGAFSSYHNGRNQSGSVGMVGPGTTLRPLPGNGVVPASSAAGALASVAGESLANAATTGAGSLFGLAFQTANFSALLSFLESQGTVHVLSSPRIAALNNQPAVLKDGSEEFYVTGVSTTTNGSTSGAAVTTPSVTLQPFFSGVVLDVTPQIDDAGNIIFHVHPSVSQVQTVNKSINLGNIGNYNLPLAASTTSEADTVVRGTDGHIVALGGMIREVAVNDQNGLPGVSHIPFLGKALGNTSRSTQKRELVILIKPTVVRDGASWGEDMEGASRRVRDLEPRGR